MRRQADLRGAAPDVALAWRRRWRQAALVATGA